MKAVALTRGKIAWVSDRDFLKVAKHKWRVSYTDGKEYAKTTICGVDTYLHRFLMLPGEVEKVDHRDGNGLNNLRSNLRVCSNAQNIRNARKYRNGVGVTSQFRGVSWAKDKNKWLVHIRVNRIARHLGLFENEEAAAKAYDRAARKYFGQFASPNFR